MSERYYLDSDLALGPVELEGPEAHHLAVVCRLRAGDSLILFNGRGGEYPARVVEVGKCRVKVEVVAIERPARALGFRLEVAAPLPKGDRADFLFEKLTELGVTAFVPLRTSRSVVQPREAKLGRLQRHVIEASKQCGRNVLMQVRELTDWKEYCGQSERPSFRLLAQPGGAAVATAVPESRCDVAVAVGPEGGFSDDETAQAIDLGWRLIDLGPRILRVETAAIALAAFLGLRCSQTS